MSKKCSIFARKIACDMKILLILLSVVTFTIESKDKVSLSGDAWPYDIQVSYACSYQAGQVRANDTATLRLGGLENVQIESVQLYMRSNKTAGAGIIKITADGENLYTQSGTYIDWFGAYDNSNYQPIGWTGKKKLNDGTLVVEVAGTTNSLYIEKYEVTWTQPASVAYNVTLMTEGVAEVLRETAPESGVKLPIKPNKNGLYFTGWTLEEINNTGNQPYMLSPGVWYYPKKDMTLWAVWSNVKEPTWTKHSVPEDGFYVMDLLGYTLAGTISGGTVPMVDNSEMVYESNLYEIHFNTTDSTCTIRNYGAEENTGYIGFNDERNALLARESAWTYLMLPDSTWYFIAKEEGDRTWMLFKKDYYHAEAWLSHYGNAHATTGGGWELYQLPNPSVKRHWTSHPSVDAIEVVNGERLMENGEWIIPFGIYDLIIKDGKKYLRIR